MKSIFTGHGYFMNDDRASGGKLAEDDVVTCIHHGGVLKKHEWKLQGGMCMICHGPLCDHCYEQTRKLGCTGPQEKMIERAVNDLYRREQNSKAL